MFCRKTLILFFVFLSCLVQTGCFLAPGGVYSYQEFGPAEVTGETLGDVIARNGCPDLIGGNGKFLVMGWVRTEGSQVLGIWSTVEKKNHAVLCNEEGKVIARGTVDAGRGLALFGYAMFPVQVVQH
jgi:hypothetical protein